MPQNVWSAGRDEMLKTLAARDAQSRLEEEQRRRAAADESAAAARTEQLGLQRRNTEALEGERAARTAEIERGTTEKTAKEEKVRKLIGVVTDKALDQSVRDAAGLELDAMGVAPNALKAFVTQPKPEMKPVMRIGRDGKMSQIGEAPPGAHFSTEPAPRVPRAPAAGPKQDPTLPAGVTAWIDSIGQRGVPIEAARAELSKGWRQQVASHPRAQLSDAAKYLDSLYPKDALGQRENIFGAGSDEGADPIKAEFAVAEELTGRDVTKPITIVAPTGEERVMPYEQAKVFLSKGAKVKR